MADFKFELDREGVGELLKSDGMKSVVAQHAASVLGRLPSGYGMSVGETSQRAKATVGTRGIKGELDNKRNNSLLKALGGG